MKLKIPEASAETTRTPTDRDPSLYYIVFIYTLLILKTMIRDRDISPFSNISKALFTRFSSSEQPSSTSRKRSSRPSLEDDLRRSSNENQENIDPGDLRRSSTKLSKPSYSESPKKSTERNHLGANSNRPRGLSNRNCNKDAEVFQYPSPLDAPPRLVKSTYHYMTCRLTASSM